MLGSTSATTSSVQLAGSLQRVFSTNRWFTCSRVTPSNLYSVPLPAAVYTVRLHFAMTYVGTSQPGQRVFDVFINGALVASSVDLARTPGFLTAYTISVPGVDCRSGPLLVGFRSVAENPLLSGIEVLTA
jgi:hypothetical protein